MGHRVALDARFAQGGDIVAIYGHPAFKDENCATVLAADFGHRAIDFHGRLRDDFIVRYAHL